MYLCKLVELVLIVRRNFIKITETVSSTVVDFATEYCYNDGAISRNNNGVVTACVNGYNTSVCYPVYHSVAYSLAVAACNSQRLGAYCK